MYNLIIAWILTLFIEFLVIWLFIRKEPLKLLFYSFLINSITLPLATFTYIYLYPSFFLTETAVFLAETVLLKLLLEIDYPRALSISLAANIITALFGFYI
ncbi:hypothetical protein [Methanobacterium sp.]|uniref:hypothetical protein n=1 Tax=Methanobacterium sp. TaxID=2164 RepID=UPI0025FC09FC|nr:hypothetical protein [Methanobacterium sp.]MBI5459154.1 hypothetical protein [Methanobacterium sp.]